MVIGVQDKLSKDVNNAQGADISYRAPTKHNIGPLAGISRYESNP